MSTGRAQQLKDGAVPETVPGADLGAAAILLSRGAPGLAEHVEDGEALELGKQVLDCTTSTVINWRAASSHARRRLSVVTFLLVAPLTPTELSWQICEGSEASQLGGTVGRTAPPCIESPPPKPTCFRSFVL